MALILPRAAIVKQQGREYGPHAPKPKPHAPAPVAEGPAPKTDPALTGALKLVIAAVKDGTAAQERLMAELLAALAKPKPAIEGLTATVTARDAGGRIKDVAFKVKRG